MCQKVRMVAWAALALNLRDRSNWWAERATTIGARILQSAWNDRRQSFVESFEGEHLDASVLLMAEVGFIDPRDPRFVSTLRALEEHLCAGPFMRRYEEADDFGRPQTAFKVCAFRRIDALVRIDRNVEAREIFEAVLACRNPLGLLSEDVAPAKSRVRWPKRFRGQSRDPPLFGSLRAWQFTFGVKKKGPNKGTPKRRTKSTDCLTSARTTADK